MDERKSKVERVRIKELTRRIAADAFINVFYPLDSDSESECAIEDVPGNASAGL